MNLANDKIHFPVHLYRYYIRFVIIMYIYNLMAFFTCHCNNTGVIDNIYNGWIPFR